MHRLITCPRPVGEKPCGIRRITAATGAHAIQIDQDHLLFCGDQQIARLRIPVRDVGTTQTEQEP